jgi:hypothetical protein
VHLDLLSPPYETRDAMPVGAGGGALAAAHACFGIDSEQSACRLQAEDVADIRGGRASNGTQARRNLWAASGECSEHWQGYAERVARPQRDGRCRRERIEQTARDDVPGERERSHLGAAALLALKLHHAAEHHEGLAIRLRAIQDRLSATTSHDPRCVQELTHASIAQRIPQPEQHQIVADRGALHASELSFDGAIETSALSAATVDADRH